jgi:hypothetical protein
MRDAMRYFESMAFFWGFQIIKNLWEPVLDRIHFIHIKIWYVSMIYAYVGIVHVHMYIYIY